MWMSLEELHNFDWIFCLHNLLELLDAHKLPRLRNLSLLLSKKNIVKVLLIVVTELWCL